MQRSTQHLSQVILKIAARCNLNCSYCYVYHKADSSWKHRTAIMSDEVFDAALERIGRHCAFTGQTNMGITFHGGEPCLVGAKRFDFWCTKVRRYLAEDVTVDLGIQTNGTLLDQEWAEVFEKHRVDVGISMDGPQELHDVFRVDHKGQGSYARVERGLKILQNARISFGIMAVIPFGADPVKIHRHFVAMGCRSITYLLPHFTHDTIEPIRKRYGETPCADFLIPVFDEWWFNGTMDVRVRDLWNLARIILGGNSEIETFGNAPPLYAFVESDGAIEGLDSLYICEDGITSIGLNVRNADFRQILETDSMHKTAIFEGMPLPHVCRDCPERVGCGGGYLPHRYSSARGFDNPSVWCADFLKLFVHLRARLGITVEESRARREALLSRVAIASAVPGPNKTEGIVL